jgi:16S rRNA (cytidine1402-2'-O)-methyltransferase
LEFDRFAFAGFPPIRSNDRAEWLSWVESLPDVPVVGFEAPHRIQKTLKELAGYFGNRPILLARELTKLHEQWLEGFTSALEMKPGELRGEFVFVLGPAPKAGNQMIPPDDSEIALVFGQITEHPHGTRRQAIRDAARKLGIPARAVFAALERHKTSGK